MELDPITYGLVTCAIVYDRGEFDQAHTILSNHGAGWEEPIYPSALSAVYKENSNTYALPLSGTRGCQGAAELWYHLR